jgi:hypothetical protein
MSDENINADIMALKALTRGAYDLQALRTKTGNNLCSAYRKKLGIEPGVSEDDEENEDAKKILDEIRAEFKKMTDGVKRELPAMKAFKGTPVITTYAELCLVARYINLEQDEDRTFRRIGTLLEDVPIYRDYLKGVVGCGVTMAAVIVTGINIHKCEYPSSVWKYCGYDVAPDGAGRSKRKEHLVKREYTTKKKTKAMRDSVTYNPFLKTKLYVLGGCLIKSGNEKYRKIYDDYKHRLEHHEKYGIANDKNRIAEIREKYDYAYAPKGHRHAMAMRYMIKMFLTDLYNYWRAQEGLPVAPTYSEAKLGKTHGKA